jgi:membrane-bound lytic murein transglycosylase F
MQSQFDAHHSREQMPILKNKVGNVGSLWRSLVCIIVLICLSACSRDNPSRLDQIWRTGKITLITDNNAHCYYLYRDRPAGFEYELASAFAKFLVVDLNVVTPGWDEMFHTLQAGKGDFIAASLTRTPDRTREMDFSEPYLIIEQFAIVHKNNPEIQSLEDLEGQTVHVRNNTSYHRRLLELRQSGVDVRVRLHKNVPTEELFRQVAENEIDVTVADTNVALLNRRYYPDAQMRFQISNQQSIGWAVRKGDRQLRRVINRFFKRVKEDGTFERIYYKYYSYVEIFDYFDLKKFHERIQTRLPRYERIIRRESRRYGFDWRLMAAVIYQESHFNPRAVSYTGVRGLMQLTLDTASDVGVANRLDPEESIVGGLKYLDMLRHRFDDVTGFDRMLFALASYNVGYGHVRDAQAIAARKGRNPNKWADLKQTLPLLRYPKYYRQTAYGYARGTEPVRYVKRILTYYDILRRSGLTYRPE